MRFFLTDSPTKTVKTVSLQILPKHFVKPAKTDIVRSRLSPVYQEPHKTLTNPYPANPTTEKENRL
jgi:hypothetical protein